jgi:hypothetical protein
LYFDKEKEMHLSGATLFLALAVVQAAEFPYMDDLVPRIEALKKLESKAGEKETKKFESQLEASLRRQAASEKRHAQYFGSLSLDQIKMALQRKDKAVMDGTNVGCVAVHTTSTGALGQFGRELPQGERRA